MELGLKRDEVRLVPYDPVWRYEFEQTKKCIRELTQLEREQIEHIGSTAIAGIWAKPMIDLLIGVEQVDMLDKELERGLRQAGFLRLRVQREQEIVFAKFTDSTYQTKTHVAHMVVKNSALWNNLLFFRDYLNENEAARKAYEQLKQFSVKETNNNIKAYTDSKEAFVKRIYAKRC
ncbi:GrpB family protein [Ornithinibacillus gellani]|uniref:GrpB family protein n=1 Tax=Ornithinibacillus gellani TaxID=2293253 RepID=UPI000F48DD1F|nr:GrpB family protein [Ornithinibacillus gellani]TQS74174.1 GrpB family protein [Ornithinibacillus gellani]